MKQAEMERRVKRHFIRQLSTLDPRKARYLTANIVGWMTDGAQGDERIYDEAVPAVIEHTQWQDVAIRFARKLYRTRPAHRK